MAHSGVVTSPLYNSLYSVHYPPGLTPYRGFETLGMEAKQLQIGIDMLARLGEEYSATIALREKFPWKVKAEDAVSARCMMYTLPDQLANLRKWRQALDEEFVHRNAQEEQRLVRLAEAAADA
jgi:hypothetical protein